MAIMNASYCGNAEILNLLLADIRGETKVSRRTLYAVDPSLDNSFTIQIASKYGHFEVVKLLLADGRSDPSLNDNKAIRLAYENCYPKIVKLLLEDGRISVKAKTKSISALTATRLYQKRSLPPLFDIHKIKYLANLPLRDLIEHGEYFEEDRELHFV